MLRHRQAASFPAFVPLSPKAGRVSVVRTILPDLSTVVTDLEMTEPSALRFVTVRILVPSALSAVTSVGGLQNRCPSRKDPTAG